MVLGTITKCSDCTGVLTFKCPDLTGSTVYMYTRNRVSYLLGVHTPSGIHHFTTIYPPASSVYIHQQIP